MPNTINATIGQLVEAEAALQRLAAHKLDAKTRYHVVKLARLVTEETSTHFHEPRQALIVEMGFDKMPTVPPDQMPAFLGKLRPLADVPVTLPWGPITSGMLETAPDVTAADLIALGPLFVLEEPTAAE